MLDWRTVTNDRHPKFMVKGTELATAIVPNTLSRFQICEHRIFIDGDYAMPDREYCVRDAHTVSDAETRDGIRSRIVSRHATEAEALSWCYAQSS